MLTLSRGQIGQQAQPGMYVADITVKSARGAWRRLVPSWDMVMQHKRGQMSDVEYTQRYHAILEKEAARPNNLFDRLDEEMRAHDYTHVMFVCYCADGKFCHTHLLIQWMIQHYPKLYGRYR